MIRWMIILTISLLSLSQGMRFLMPSQANVQWFESLRWKHRLIVISGTEELVRLQRERFMSVEPDVLDRDVLLMTVILSPDTPSDDTVFSDTHSIMSHLGITSSQFQVLLVGKDGEIKEHRYEPVEPLDFFRCIDVMPMRVMEMLKRDTT